MATDPTPSPGPAPQPSRRYRAACPNCGAPVSFASAASASAVCSFCRSTLLREGDALRRIGVSAELFDDHSPLQLGASGRHQGLPFTLVGRLQYRYPEGSWNEWHALFESSGGAPRSAWLSEDNGAYVLAFDQPAPADIPALDGLQAGERRLLGGQAWSVASVVSAELAAAEGELPRPPQLGRRFTVVDLRSAAGEVGTLDDSDPAAPSWSIGRSVALSALALQGLREASDKTLGARGVECPSCGTALAPTLSTTRSISCPQCRAVVDLSGGVGEDLKFYAQNNSGDGGLEPQIPLGSVGRLALGAEGPLDWQVVGYQERCDVIPDEDEQSFWREYLLWHRTAGFVFLVDTDEGWSWMRPLTGAPVASGKTVRWEGLTFEKRYSYPAKVTWVQGEFYWRVQREERAQVTDYDGPRGAKLSREQTGTPKTGGEVTWSLGKTLGADEVQRAFRLPAAAAAALRRDAAPLAGKFSGLSQGVIILLVVLLVILLMARCDGDRDCEQERDTFGEASAEYQQCRNRARSGGSSSGGVVGGSWGGYSSGSGGHK